MLLSANLAHAAPLGKTYFALIAEERESAGFSAEFGYLVAEKTQIIVAGGGNMGEHIASSANGSRVERANSCQIQTLSQPPHLLDFPIN